MTDPAEQPATADLGHTLLDMDRVRRIGMPEAIYAAGKTPAQCVEIVRRLLADSDHPVVVTRCGADHRVALEQLSPESIWSDTMTWRHAPAESRHTNLGSGPITVVSAGTSDQSVLDECVGTLTAHGAMVRVVLDVGVAGLHRLLGSLDEFDGSSAVIAIAGMEAALPTVLAGLVAAPIVAVPTSVGYGTTFDGLTALLSMLSSCAPGVSVVGIDNGYGAACAALRILGAAELGGTP